MKNTRTKGRWIFKQHWNSICTIHYFHDQYCDKCKIGEWKNPTKEKYKELWRKWSAR